MEKHRIILVGTNQLSAVFLPRWFHNDGERDDGEMQAMKMVVRELITIKIGKGNREMQDSCNLRMEREDKYLKRTDWNPIIRLRKLLEKSWDDFVAMLLEIKWMKDGQLR